ncbi:MAG TPA: M23 family metallopeptidase [Candidatus Coproplasma excrementigallinarum]|uniref:M23 family metallopeptidase n=1 Tax=Candidatus Coproplasma excrementigallinarum TaxID=2840747 RepID=A0A9D1SIG9_9FIRM|nr:M23 family metallopeptidase [Candidatus Coproplasma excrementigallinarum]
MKDQEQKPKNKKLLTYYLILGACILIIAAVAVAVTLSLTLGGNDMTVDGGNDQTDDDGTDNPDDGGDATDTDGDTTFLIPVSEANALNSYGFYHNTTLDKYYLHTGIDFAGEAGDEVYAALDGTVESITTDPLLMGTTITLAHENGLKTVYTFVEAADGLEVGETVEKGDVIATVAEAMGQEYKDGAHLHFEVFLNGEAVDPETYLEISEK